LRVLYDILASNTLNPINKAAVTTTLNAICVHHAPLQQGNELLWALWIAKSQLIVLNTDAVAAISQVDDDLVALTALHLQSEGLMPDLVTNLWGTYAAKEHLYSEHWLLAYEGVRKGWLKPVDGINYIDTDLFFSILQKHDVTFYDIGATVQAEGSVYKEDENEYPLSNSFGESPDELPY